MHGEVATTGSATTAGLDFAASSGGCSGDRSTASHWSKVSASIIHDSCTVEGLQGERLILDRRCQPDGCSIWRVQLVAWVPECAVQPALADDFRRQHDISGETSKRASIQSPCAGLPQHCKATAHSPQELHCQRKDCHSRRTSQCVDSSIKRHQA